MDKIIERLVELAKNSAKNGGGPFSAIVADSKGNIISEETNNVTKLNDPTAHAEVLAIRSACKNLGTFNLKGYSIYASCEPCPMCLSAIYWARIENIYFLASKEDAKKAGFSDAFIYDELCKPIDKRSIKTIKLDSDNYLEPFNVWEDNKNKVKY